MQNTNIIHAELFYSQKAEEKIYREAKKSSFNAKNNVSFYIKKCSYFIDKTIL